MVFPDLLAKMHKAETGEQFAEIARLEASAIEARFYGEKAVEKALFPKWFDFENGQIPRANP